MTAIDELRRMLDERGIEHGDDEDVTRFFGPDGFEVVMQEDIDGRLDCLTPLYFTPAQAIAATLGETPTPPPPTMPEQPPYDLLIDLLRDEWGIDVSWDGLRRFWSIELTEGGCLMRDRACKAEAENAELRELVRTLYMCSESLCNQCEYIHGPFCKFDAETELRELGIEVDE